MIRKDKGDDGMNIYIYITSCILAPPVTLAVFLTEQDRLVIL